MTVSVNGFDHAVRWNEFSRVAEPPARSNETAHIEASLHFDYRWGWTGSEYGVVEVTATITINSAESWVVQGTETSRLLSHEQGHFDISAIALREAANLIAALTAGRGAQIDRRKTQIETRMRRRSKALNDRYDIRTDHYRNRATQSQWDRAIAAVKTNDQGELDNLPQ